MTSKIDRNELLSELNHIADLLGCTPSEKQFGRYSGYGVGTYENRFGSWGDALIAAGLDVPKFTNSIAKQELLNDFERVARELERTPTPRDMNEYGKYSDGTYSKAFGSWDNMVDVSTVDPWEIGSGENHPAWNGGHRGYETYGPNWQTQRKKALERDDYECRVCGLNDKEHKEEYGHSLHVHHITPARNFDDCQRRNALSNLITLCRRCHNQYEGWNLKPDV